MLDLRMGQGSGGRPASQAHRQDRKERRILRDGRPENTAVRPEAARLLHVLKELPGRYSMAELAGLVKVSKTKVREALWELEEANIVHISTEEE